MAIVHAVVTLRNANGDPLDIYQNNFWFEGPTGATDLANLAAALEAFYDVPAAGQTNPLSAYISTQVARTNSGPTASTVRIYEVDPGPPHNETPIYETGFTLGAALGSSFPLPSEVALTGSFYATPSEPSRRGRIYLGPLNTAALGSITVGEVRPVTELQVGLAGKMQDLKNSGFNGSAYDWGVWGKSAVIGQVKVLRPVTNGWVDNAFDTQRRRGSKATARTTF